MAPVHSKLCSSNPSNYFFSASRRREHGSPTLVECVAPAPARRARGAVLTATRQFKSYTTSIKRQTQLRRHETLVDLTSRGGTPGPSGSSKRGATPPAARAYSPSGESASSEESSLSSIPSSPSPPPLPKATVNVRGSVKPQAGSAPRGSLLQRKKLGKKASLATIADYLRPNGELITRYGEMDGEPFFLKDNRTTSTTDPDVRTPFWESFSAEPILNPPDLTSYPDLKVGDLYSNVVLDLPTVTVQLWTWSVSADGKGYWKKTREGAVRDDGRRLTITPTRHQPSWVSPGWGIKQLRNPKAR
ncbi:hypothetical protein C8Q76DRAFT_789324 [Earliella scabrosa]|nr:hypothetical protein C8Q76DRAFT_802178 [Earliella scabrosa]KAI0744849.1 hypothetical protein C8Q76DRAFT_789324 [Earliella scabrosa]